MATDNSSQPIYFLSESLWTEAVNLLKFQLSQKAVNRHFRTMSMYYYERLGAGTSIIETPEYFMTRIASGLFYGLSNEFAVHTYPIPKSRLGLRGYKFLLYPLRVLYYAITLYLVMLTEQLIRDHKKERPCIFSFYGADLEFLKDGRLRLDSRAVYYRSHYKAFRKQIRKEANAANANRKLVMRLDITNYYDSIRVKTLLRKLADSVKPSIQKKLRFDASTAQQIERFLDYISRGAQGIPQFDNDIASSFLGYLYLVFGEKIIDDEIRRYGNLIDAYALVRYMDDTFISITFKEAVSESEQRRFAERLVEHVLDALNRDLNLNMNPKTELFWLSAEEERERLLGTLRRVSPQYHLASDEAGDETVVNKVNAILNHLRELKSTPIDPLRDYSKTLEEEILSDVFDPQVSAFLEQGSALTYLSNIFSEFNFDIVKARPLEFLILILKNQSSTEQFREFLLQIDNLTSTDINLILRFLCQTEFSDTELLDMLAQTTQMSDVITVFREQSLYSEYPGYFQLSVSRTMHILEIPNVIEQMQQRIIDERSGDYSTALNHLVNEFQKIAWHYDPKRPARLNEYRAPNIVSFLDQRQIPSELRTKITNMFDRRNANTVSHPGDDVAPAWGVEPDEYWKYWAAVGQCLEYILPP